MLAALGRADNPRLIVLEGREALRAEPAEAIEAALHAVNEFVRADAGANTLVVCKIALKSNQDQEPLRETCDVQPALLDSPLSNSVVLK